MKKRVKVQIDPVYENSYTFNNDKTFVIWTPFNQCDNFEPRVLNIIDSYLHTYDRLRIQCHHWFVHWGLSKDYTKALICSAMVGNLDNVQHFMSLGVDAEAKQAMITENKSMAVRMASQFGHLDTLIYLVSQVADTEAKRVMVTAWNNYSIRMASGNGYLNTVRYLVSLGADIAACNNDAVLRAAINGHLEVVKYLVSQGADILTNDYWLSRTNTTIL